ncbi:MAG TPA: Fis family transcriptional regulator [Desulfobacteraceae bacterium]|nr:Fis family transcriptional regulator [Desulfobacteraceae bacterium]
MWDERSLYILVTEEGIVIRAEKLVAWVKMVRSSACESCSEKDTCNSMGGSGHEMEVEAINAAGAKAGDKVVVAFETASLFKVSFLIYLFPVFSMIAGAFIGQGIAKTNHGDPSAYAAISAFLSFLIAFFIIRAVSKVLAKDSRYRAKILRIR